MIEVTAKLLFSLWCNGDFISASLSSIEYSLVMGLFFGAAV